MKKLHKLCALLLSMAMALSCASLPAVAAEVGVSEGTVVVSTDTEETTEEESEEESAEEADTTEEENEAEEAADGSEEETEESAEEETEESAEEEATVEAAEAEEIEEGDESVEAESSTVPTATAESTLFGYGYTAGGSCLRGDTVDSLTGSATISLALDEGDIDDSLIDSSNATVKLVDGDGYYAAEFLFSATTLTGSWENGQTTYTMDVEDLVWDNTVYSGEMGDATRQWSAFGGDGNGCYTFYLEVSGITYNGQEVASTTFPVEIYIFGRDGTDRGTVFDDEVSLPTATESSSGKSQSSETQWTWSGDDSAGVPILCDSLADDFYITWPSGTDASGVTASDVTVTLSNEYGTTYTLETENAYGEVQYVVYSSEGETQVAVTFMHWAYTPVFTTMTITVDGDGLTATKTYDVASVYAYIVQSGGRASGDGNTVTYSFYGLDLDSLTSVYQLAKDTEDYTLYTTVDDTTYYYAEDESGNGYLTTDEDEAAVYTQSTEVREPALVNSTVFIENRLTLTEDKTVDGETVTFTKELGNGDGNNNLYMKGEDVLANGVKAAKGYVIGENLTPYDGNGNRYGTLMPYEHWAWQTRFSAGWTSEDGTTATSFPYVSFPYGYAAGETPSTGGDEEEETVEVSVTAESTLFGYAYTDGLSCLMSDTIDSLTGEATISLALSEGDVDDSLIDSSNAVVTLAEGDGYYADELTLGVTALTGSWENGQISYTLDVEDLVWNNTVYTEGYSGGTRQWSCFGGDGNGCYTFNLEVSGITYNGQEVDTVTFQVEVYIFGRSGADLAAGYNSEEDAVAVESSSGISQTDEIQWTWSGDDSAGVPILCDNQTDDFYITWPTGTDASGLTAENVTVTLYSEYGDSYTLQTENDYGEKQYAVFSSEGETQVAVMFRHWAYTPVFTTMTITVDGDDLTASKTYEIGSVYVHMVQSGGHPSHDGDVVTFSYYGLDEDSLTSVWQLAKEPYYTLTTTVDGTTYYYAEDENGASYLTEDADAAATFDATDDRTPTLVGSTVFLQNRLNQTEIKTVDGEDVTFDKVYAYDDGDDNVYKTGEALTANGVKPAAGYVMWDTGYEGTMWSWQDRFLSGWTEEDGTTATSLPYVSFPYGYEAGSTSGDEEEEEEPVEAAESDIFGSADTGNKSTLKAALVKTSGPGDTYLYYYNEDGERVQYEDQTATYEADTVTYTGSATISLALSEGDIDDSKIDSGNAVVKLAEGDGYYPEELVLAATSLTGSWENGQMTYTLSEGDLEWYTGDYEWSDYNSGREWSCFGGDGNGYYTFNFEVSGITYDGVEVDAVQFQVNVYIWGREGTDMASSFNDIESPVAVESTSGVSQTDEIQWTWSGDTTTGDPILCDNLADDFYITWPSGTDASGLTADDVTVTLYNAYGDSYTLQTENAYGEKQYSVFSSEGETQVAVTFMHWAYVPVFTTMTITVDGDGLTASKTYDVDSVYIYMVQQGGGGVTVDGTVTTYSYYGFENLDDIWQIMTKSTYVLTTTIDGTTYYYAEDGTLTTDKSEAQSFDASGEEDTNQQLIGNTAWITTRLNQTEDKTVDGETITFDKSYSSGSTANATTAAANGLVAADGYILGSSITPYEMWAWQDRFLAGYTTSEAEPTGSPYVSFPYGYEAGSTGGETETVDTSALTAAIEQAEALTESD
ncbi:MAG: hypothetical protein LUD78_03010, partial [Clostridiales bacterium]|nr:hypothetical protein [Clostridiales bacterium]